MADSKPLFTNPRQERIHKRLSRIGPGPAAFYRDICRLMGEASDLETMAHLTSHLLREIESALRAVLLPSNYLPPSQDGHKEQVRSILKSYGFSESDDVWKAWHALLEARLDRLAHRNDLRQPRCADDDNRGVWERFEQILDVILARFETRFLDSIAALDELIAKPGPTSRDAERLRNRIPQNETTPGYFFEHVENPAWLSLLAEKGFFEDPPAPVKDEAGVRTPIWPEARYLARMAKKPELEDQVVEIALKIPDTANPYVNECLADVALAVRPDLAVRFAPKVPKWLDSPYRVLLGEKLGALAVHLAQGGHIEAALSVVSATLSPIVPQAPGEDAESRSSEARPRIDLWTYGQMAKKQIPVLAELGGQATVQTLCDLLDKVLEIERPKPAQLGPDEKEREDYSYVWRPAIEGHEFNQGDDLKNILVTTLRDALVKAASSDSSAVHALVGLAESYSWKLFRRLGLHLLRSFPSVPVPLLLDRLNNRALFDDSCFWHEYVLLLRTALPMLPVGQPAAFFAWVEEGPDLSEWKKEPTDSSEKAPTEAELIRYGKQWRVDKLAVLREVLPPEWRKKYEEWSREVGEPEHPEFRSYMTAGWVGPTSPKGAAELKAMTVPEIVAYLAAWKPPQGFMSDSPEGLNRELDAVVAGDAERFAESAHLFKGVDPIYVRAIISGFGKAIGLHPFSWKPVLDLCLWVVNQKPEDPDYNGREDRGRDLGWRWSRTEIARLLHAGFQKDSIPMEMRKLAWSVLELITSDPHPTPTYEGKYGGDNMDPNSLSINSTRGEAMHTVISYCLWVRRHNDKLPNGAELAQRGFAELPEVKRVLDLHLDPTRDPSLAIRSVYGRWLPQLYLLDAVWIASHLPQIFPDDESGRAVRDAAWEAYVCFCDPDDNLLPVLAGEYEKALRRLGVSGQRKRHIGNPQDRLVQHLMLYYLRGRLGMEDPGGLLHRFYATATPEAKKEAIHWLGRVLFEHQRDGKDLPKEILDRCVELWQTRFAAASEEGAGNELEPFGWWFVSGMLDGRWLIIQLREVLKITGSVDPDSISLERLAVVSSEFPAEALDCARLMIEGAKEPWLVMAGRDHIRSIISATLAAAIPAAKKAAVELVNLLAAKGHLEFRDLLEG